MISILYTNVHLLCPFEFKLYIVFLLYLFILKCHLSSILISYVLFYYTLLTILFHDYAEDIYSSYHIYIKVLTFNSKTLHGDFIDFFNFNKKIFCENY